MPVEAGWIVKRRATDLTGRSLRGADATGASLRSGPDKQVPPKDKLGGARLSCPLISNGLQNAVLRTRRARPSEECLAKRGSPPLLL